MLPTLLLLLTGCLGDADDERLLTEPFEGRMTMARENRTMGEIVSSRSVTAGRATAVLVTANLGSRPGVSEPGTAVFAFRLEIDCEQGMSRTVRQELYGRDGALKEAFDLDNRFAANEDLAGLIGEVCDASGDPDRRIVFRTIDEYWALVQQQLDSSLE